LTCRTDGSTVGRPNQSIRTLHRGCLRADIDSMTFSPQPPGQRKQIHFSIEPSRTTTSRRGHISLAEG
jgi:hypothetical protein